MDSGTSLLGDSGYTGRTDPVNGNVGKGLKKPTAA